MKVTESKIEGCFLITNHSGADSRGGFAKLFNQSRFQELLNYKSGFNEVFVSSSKKDVIRGMHFQTPPHEQAKVVSCLSGRALDVVVDLRPHSKTFREFESFELSSPATSVFIPHGCAHGFLAQANDTTLLYLLETELFVECDKGVRWDSFGFNWPVTNPIVSDKDKNWSSLANYNSPF